jgi:ribosome-associated toxin RatA of RatAB toxin-antitoxin module
MNPNTWHSFHSTSIGTALVNYAPALATRMHAIRDAVLNYRRWTMPAFAALLCTAAQAAPSVIDVQRVDAAVRVQASATVRASALTTWNTLIGYDQLPEFIPDMISSKTVQRDGLNAVVEQRGRAGLGPFKQDFAITLAVREDFMQSVQAKAVAGDFSRFESSYRLQPDGNGLTRIDYLALIEPKAGIPPLVASSTPYLPRSSAVLWHLPP